MEMRGRRLHVDAFKPTRSGHLRNVLSIMNIALVNPR